MRAAAGALAVVCLIAGPAVTQAQSPPVTLGYAGFLAEDDVPVDATYDVLVEFYDRPEPELDETLVWSEMHASTEIVAGAFALALGSLEPLTLEMLSGSPIFVELTVDGDVMRPRLPLDSVPYARLADVSRNSTNVGGVTVGETQVIDETGAWVGPGEVIDDLECEADQIPVRGNDGWGCGTFEAEDATFGLGDQACPENSFLAGFDETGAAVCDDYSQAVDQAFLDENGYMTQTDIDAAGFYSADNRPDWTVVEDVPAAWQDGDQETVLSGAAPISVGSNSVGLSNNGCSGGHVLRWNGSSFQCQSPPQLDCTTPSQGFTTSAVTVSCPGGYTLTGGGIQVRNDNGGIFDVVEGRPSGNAWRCFNDDIPTNWEGASTCYARCCRLN